MVLRTTRLTNSRRNKSTFGHLQGPQLRAPRRSSGLLRQVFARFFLHCIAGCIDVVRTGKLGMISRRIYRGMSLPGRSPQRRPSNPGVATKVDPPVNGREFAQTTTFRLCTEHTTSPAVLPIRWIIHVRMRRQKSHTIRDPAQRLPNTSCDDAFLLAVQAS